MVSVFTVRDLAVLLARERICIGLDDPVATAERLCRAGISVSPRDVPLLAEDLDLFASQGVEVDCVLVEGDCETEVITLWRRDDMYIAVRKRVHGGGKAVVVEVCACASLEEAGRIVEEMVCRAVSRC